MELNDKATLSKIAGPYEVWALDEPGRSYGIGALSKADTRHFAAMAELPDDHLLLRERSISTTENGRFRTPILWKNAFMNMGKAACFVPMVFEPPVPAGDRSPTSRDIATSLFTLAAIRKEAMFTTFGGDITPAIQTGFRVNSPLPPRTVETSDPPNGDGRPVVTDTDLVSRLPNEAGVPPVVIVAVIDDGIPIATRNLRDRNGRSRMEFCWLQSAPLAEPPLFRTVLFGRELTGEDIAGLVKKHQGDEDAIERAARSRHAGEPHTGSASHGAGVLDLAAGFHHLPDGASGLGLDRIRVIGVELPAPVMLDTVGFGKDAFVLAAFHYVFARADAIAAAYGVKALPLVINFSFGFSGGPHDGTDRLEQAIEDLVKARKKEAPTVLVMPAGNTFNSRLYGEIDVERASLPASGILPWRLQPSDATSNYLEVWYPASPGADDPPGAGEDGKPGWPEIFDPSGSPVFLKEGPAGTASHTDIRPLLRDGHQIGQVSLDRFRGRRWRLLIVLAPTEPRDPALPRCPAGLWRVKVDGTTAEGRGVISCRLQRDQDLSGRNPASRQSYFDDRNDVPIHESGRLATEDTPGAFVRRFGTLNGLATHNHVLVVGGFVGDAVLDGSGGEMTVRPVPAAYSSAGRDTATGGPNVHCSASSDQSYAVRGVRTTGTRSGSSDRLIGTSAATPQVARNIAFAYLHSELPHQSLGSHKLGDVPIMNLHVFPGTSGGSEFGAVLTRRLGAGVLFTPRNWGGSPEVS
ncbi:MAG: hypothetical protein Q8O26_18995 [Phreatobacter sp.]|uniref:hypothetical protein n=1 Tax=Phreatobacter sp. TaxID=1966341 RepID=UPI002734F779|nr:hypothetical protein [Phreatobacter sp.]MDP2803965.1 hypothetical protein [Phreatobacter sp.]